MTSTFTIQRLRPEHAARVPGLLDMFGLAFENPGSYGTKRPDAAYGISMQENQAAPRQGRALLVAKE